MFFLHCKVTHLVIYRKIVMKTQFDSHLPKPFLWIVVVLAFNASSIPTTCFAQPTIRRQPIDQTVSLEANVSFTVTARGIAPLTYQWRLDEEDIPDALASKYELTNASMQMAGNYSVVVTDSSGSTVSDVVSLEVDPTFTTITTGQIVTDRSSFSSVAWGDYDNDGYIDLVAGASQFSPSPFEAVHVYKNNGPGTEGVTFTKDTTSPIATTKMNATGLAWSDYNNDGHLDLFVADYGSRNNLYQNKGDGTFAKVEEDPFTQNPSLGENASWADFNLDGHLDLFVTNWDDGRGLRNYFYQNRGDGTFETLTANNVGAVLSDFGSMAGVTWVDYDDDGDPDIQITSPFGGPSNQLYQNNGDGTFVKTPHREIWIVDENSRRVSTSGATGSTWGDYDNDGDLDLYVTVGAENTVSRTNLLWRNMGDGTFFLMQPDDVGPLVGDKSGYTACAWTDYDNDGWLDLYVARPGLGNIGAANLLYKNNGDGSFVKVEIGSPTTDNGTTWGVAWGDYDNNGFMDLFVSNGFLASSPQSNSLYRNNGNTNHWLKLVLVGSVSNRSAVGAKVRIKSSIGGRSQWQFREISGSSNRYSFQDIRPNFGLGEATMVDTLRIEWPSGIVQELKNVAADQILTVNEPTRLEPHLLISDEIVELKVKSWTGLVHQIEASSDLVDWTHITTLTNLTGSLRFSDPGAKNSLKRYYRLSSHQ